MKVNYLALMHTLANVELPPPMERGQTYAIRMQDRLEQVDRERGYHSSPEKYKYTELRLVAVEFGDRHERWLEWEFEF